MSPKLGLHPVRVTGNTAVAGQDEAPAFPKQEEQQVAQIAWEVIRKLENQPELLPTFAYLKKLEIQAAIVKAVEKQYQPTQLTLEGVGEKPDIAAVVAMTSDLVAQETIDIPRILVLPKGEVRSGFHPFALNLDILRYQAVSDDLWIQHLRTSDLVDQLYDLARQTVRHFGSYLSEEDTAKVLRCYQRDIARFFHAQMQEHYWEETVGYEVKVSKGFTELKPSAYISSVQEPPADYRVSPADKSNMAKYLFGGFQRCLYPVQKFDSDSERKLAVILERDTIKWFKPAKGQFQIFYRQGANHLEYQPDFVAETTYTIYMLEPKMRKEMEDPVVLAKKDAALKWCADASDHVAGYGGKAWRYVLIPHDEIADNITLGGLAARFGCQ